MTRKNPVFMRGLAFRKRLYCTTGIEVSITVENNEYSGVILSIVSSTEWPKTDGQSNIPYYGEAPFVVYKDGLAVLDPEGKWIFFDVYSHE